MMGKTILGGLLGGFALYLVGFIFWGTPLSHLAFSSADPAAAAQLQASMAQALNAGGTGVYIIPDPSTAEGTILFGRGPIAQVFYNSNGYPVTDGSALAGGFILSLVGGVLIALALRWAAGDMATRARLGIVFSAAAVLWMHVGQAIFNHAPWGYILYLSLSDFAGLAAAVLIAAKIMPDAVRADEPTLH